MVSVDNGSNSIAPDMHSSRMQRRSFRRARRGKKAGSPVSIFCDGRPPFMNILGILMRFQTTILVHEFGPPSSSRAAVVLVVDVSASLGTPTVHAERASNSPNRCSNIKRNVNESRENDENPYSPVIDLFLPPNSYKSVCKRLHVVKTENLRIWYSLY